MEQIKKELMTPDSFIKEIDVAIGHLDDKHHIAYFWTKESTISWMVQ